jgi:hypothetical protein
VVSAVEVRNPAAVKVPEFGDLISEGMKAVPFLGAYDPQEFRDLIENPYFALFLVPYTGWALLALPTGAFNPHAQVVHIYSRKRGIGKVLYNAMSDYLKKKGISSVLALNLSGHSDSAWAKHSAPEGWSGTPLGSLYQFTGAK